MDRITKITLMLIALGLWANAAATFARPASVSQRWRPQPAPAASGQLLPGRL
jgi:hypothetical protein